MKLILTTTGGITGCKLGVSSDINVKKNVFSHISVNLQTVRAHIKQMQQTYCHINMLTLLLLRLKFSITLIKSKITRKSISSM